MLGVLVFGKQWDIEKKCIAHIKADCEEENLDTFTGTEIATSPNRCKLNNYKYYYISNCIKEAIRLMSINTWVQLPIWKSTQLCI